MATLFTRAVEVNAGQEYVNIAGEGNAISPTENIRVSINRSPFAMIPAYQKVFISSTFTYVFEKNSTLLISNEIEPDFYVTLTEYSALDVTLIKDTASADIVTLTNGDKEVTKGELTAFVNIDNDTNKNVDVVITINGSTLGEIEISSPIEIKKHTFGVNAITTHVIEGTTIPADEVITFTVTADNDDLVIKGSDNPSILQLVRKNL